jgi:hypothetical protein
VYSCCCCCYYYYYYYYYYYNTTTSMTNSMEPSPSSEAYNSRRSTEPCSQDPPLISILSQMNPIHTPYSISLRSILTVLSSSQGLPNGLFPSGFSTKILYAPLFHAYYMPCPSRPPWLDHPNYIWRGIQVMKLFIMEFFPHPYYIIPLGSKFLLSTQYSNTCGEPYINVMIE